MSSRQYHYDHGRDLGRRRDLLTELDVLFKRWLETFENYNDRVFSLDGGEIAVVVDNLKLLRQSLDAKVVAIDRELRRKNACTLGTPGLCPPPLMCPVDQVLQDVINKLKEWVEIVHNLINCQWMGSQDFYSYLKDLMIGTLQMLDRHIKVNVVQAKKPSQPDTESVFPTSYSSPGRKKEDDGKDSKSVPGPDPNQTEVTKLPQHKSKHLQDSVNSGQVDEGQVITLKTIPGDKTFFTKSPHSGDSEKSMLETDLELTDIENPDEHGETVIQPEVTNRTTRGQHCGSGTQDGSVSQKDKGTNGSQDVEQKCRPGIQDNSDNRNHQETKDSKDIKQKHGAGELDNSVSTNHRATKSLQEPGVDDMANDFKQAINDKLCSEDNKIKLEENVEKVAKEEEKRKRQEAEVKAKHLKNVNQELEKKQAEQEANIKQLRKERKELGERVQCLEDKNIEVKKQCDELEQRLNISEDEKDKLLTRLSRLASEKLTKGNPNITDLSDVNRPTKLAEMYSELYDNEWTDAMESFSKNGYSDIQAINTLSETLLHIYEFCKSKSTSLMTTIDEAINLFAKDETEKSRQQNKTRVSGSSLRAHRHDPEMAKVLADYRLVQSWQRISGTSMPQDDRTQPSHIDVRTKAAKLQKDVAVGMVPVIQDAYLTQMWTRDCMSALKPFIRKCIFICWMMIVQDPPVCFLTVKPGETLNKDKFKTYTSDGPIVEYMVWPTMLLHKDGPVLCKGVVQGINQKHRTNAH